MVLEIIQIMVPILLEKWTLKMQLQSNMNYKNESTCNFLTLSSNLIKFSYNRVLILHNLLLGQE